MSVSLKEADETAYWLELLQESGYIDKERFTGLHKDCDELIRILTSITKTTKSNS
jgi:four helix bundle protein